jgi:hypothetical protein
MHKFIITLVVCLLFIQLHAQEDPSKDPAAAAKKPAKSKTFSDVIPADAITDPGLFTIHRVGQKYFFEIPKAILGRDILVASVISGHVKGLNFGGAGMRSRPQQIVRWYMQDDKILLKSVTYDAIADPSLPVAKAVQRNNFEPIIMVFDLATMSKDSSAVVFDATSLFTSDIPMIGPLSKAEKRTFEIQALDAKRSYVTSMKSYPQNTEVRHVLTFTGTNIPDNQLTNTLSIEMNQSFILLPEKIWQPRFSDERVGYFSLTRTNYGLDEQKAANQTLITRWRLEPKDPAAYFRGELVEPIKPIVYYIDPGTPMEWRPFLKKGIEDWQAAFETAGFKNAIIAKDPPSPEEDPEWSPEDVRYSVIRYITTDIQNAVGPHVHDPRSGEIIESDILWYHNVMNLLRNWFFIQTAAANPEARTPKFKKELMGELIRFVAAHEVGHTLGLPHNMGSSSAYSVDSLRAPGFVQRMGVAPSIMDYARFNYVAQPQDKGAGFYAAVGPYDKWSIEWGYKLIKDANDPDKEKPTLNQWILNKAGNPVYRFGQQQFNTIDPSGQTEDIGDDAIKASDLGIENLKVTTSKLVEWTVKPGEDFAELTELYTNVAGQFRRYMGHVVNNVGGTYEYDKTGEQKGPVYVNVAREKQIRAMQFFDRQLFTTPYWMINNEILGKIEGSGTMDRIRSLQTSTLNSLFAQDRMKRLSEQAALQGNKAYSLNDLFYDSKKMIYRELDLHTTPDAYRRNLHRALLDKLASLLTLDNTDISQSDISSLARLTVSQIKQAATREAAIIADATTKAHYLDLAQRAGLILSGEYPKPAAPLLGRMPSFDVQMKGCWDNSLEE